MIKRIFIILILLTFIPIAGFSQEDICKATLDKDRVRVGESVILSIVFYEAEDMPAPELPKIDGFDSKYLNSLQVMVKRGYMAVKAVKHRYVLFARKTGSLFIEPMTFEFDGRVFKTKKLKIEVLPGVLLESPKEAVPVEKKAKISEDRAFIVIKTEREDVYLNQQIKIEVRFYVNKKKISLTDVEYPFLLHSNFSAGEFSRPKRIKETLKEEFYDVLIFENVLFPTKTGKFVLGPAKIKCQLLTKKEKAVLGRVSGAITEAEYEYVKSPVEFTSPVLTIKVKDFPKAGRPLSFSDVIGNFNFDAEVTPTETKVGGILTLTMKMTGSGNFNMITAPGVIADNFKIYQSEVETTENAKIFKQILMPEKSGVLIIDKINFSFFNPETESYREITRGPFRINVFKAPEALPEAGLPARVTPRETAPYSLKEDLGKDIVYIKDLPGIITKKGDYLYNNKLFIIAQALPFAVFFSIFLVQRRRKRLKTDEKYARYIRAFKRARGSLNKAKTLLHPKRGEQFYALIFETLQTYIGDKFYIPAGGMTIKSIDEIARSNRLDEKIVKLLKQCFSEHDKAVFIPSEFDRREMVKLFKNVSYVINLIQRQKR
ncbi:MAG: protein BatD [Candidatus Omnitrophota bacterium]|nr:MAG: protein BatD [Candidatus Omnitrophota bacterium]